ncbi:MAG: hypothetical protein GXO22_04350 [Aquificae bacterium]|nr:hypothetical protein [Aquificota bacterium]
MEAVVKQEQPQNDIWYKAKETVNNVLDLVPKYLDIYLQTQLTQGKAGEKQPQGEPSVEVKKEESLNTKTLLFIVAGMVGIVLFVKGK